jgi:hypothetical protein
MAPAASARAKGDRDFRVRQSLATTSPILGASCPREQAALFDYSVEVRDRLKISQGGLQEAATTVLTAVQQELRARSPRLDPATAFELAGAREWALHALMFLVGPQRAKKLETALADGRPLAICGVPVYVEDRPSIGFGGAKPIETRFGVVNLPNSGCFGVFEDSLRDDRGRMWSYWCPRCKPRASKATRKQAERRAKQIARVMRQQQRPPLP